ncbi:cupredoxin domain-containing protein [Candidatus Peregrinibacteria bacterium]|nr:cupredoxin domain-containing protein [Candidatus Peregrinibacteria bacterium]MBI3816393.1 cupredoxin domain-containing protein [Candidatus Peregrinibacteria bacterium]
MRFHLLPLLLAWAIPLTATAALCPFARPLAYAAFPPAKAMAASHKKVKTVRTPAPKVVPAKRTPANSHASTKQLSAAISYSASGFSPSTATVSAGTAVTFTNASSGPMWVASNPHPFHTDSPGFDAGKSLQHGETYQFIFTKRGRWGYHNHLNPTQGGTIVVQ